MQKRAKIVIISLWTVNIQLSINSNKNNNKYKMKKKNNNFYTSRLQTDLYFVFYNDKVKLLTTIFVVFNVDIGTNVE